jgi:hypothetical protein
VEAPEVRKEKAVKQRMREHYRNCGQVLAFLSTHARLCTGAKELDANGEFALYCTYCPRLHELEDTLFYEEIDDEESEEEEEDREEPEDMLSVLDDPLHTYCAQHCEQYTLFMTGWKAGQAQARQAFETKDLALIEEIGHLAGLTSKRPPRNMSGITAEQDAADGELHGDQLAANGWRSATRQGRIGEQGLKETSS